jgi:hypothetical protein
MRLSKNTQIPNPKEALKENINPNISCPTLKKGLEEIISPNILRPVFEGVQKENADSSSSHHTIDQNLYDKSEPKPRGIFVYGTLMAEEFLSWVLTGTSDNYKSILSLRQPATLYHYRRVSVNHGDYPALIAGDVSVTVEGFLVTPANKSQ